MSFFSTYVTLTSSYLVYHEIKSRNHKFRNFLTNTKLFCLTDFLSHISPFDGSFLKIRHNRSGIQEIGTEIQNLVFKYLTLQSEAQSSFTTYSSYKKQRAHMYVSYMSICLSHLRSAGSAERTSNSSVPRTSYVFNSSGTRPCCTF